MAKKNNWLEKSAIFQTTMHLDKTQEKFIESKIDSVSCEPASVVGPSCLIPVEPKKYCCCCCCCDQIAAAAAALFPAA